jgi:hypothetical protein
MSNHNTFYYNDNNPSFIPYSTTYNDISLININWTDVISKPSFCNICLTANYNNLSNVPNLSVYASNIDVSNVSNILFINSSNSNINTSNNVITFTNNTIGTIKTSQWNSINSNIYYNEGNVGIGSSVFGNDKFIVAGIINSDEYKIKDTNISNIFITSNVFNNQSNILYTNLSNQDYKSSLNPVVSSQWITDVNSNIYYLDGNVGIGTSSFNNDKLIINGSINTTELKLKGINISNIFVTSNIYENRSNIINNNISNTFLNFSSNQFSTNGNNTFFNLSGNIGIGSMIPKEKLDINGNLNINGNIIPNTCNTFDLGSTNLKWKDLYLSGNSIHLDNLNINFSNNLLSIKDDNNNGAFLGISVNEIRLNSNNKINGIQIDTNGDLKINNRFLVGIDNNYDHSNIIYSNVFITTSNNLNDNINNKYNSLNTDTLPPGTSNRFITNDIYNRNINFTGTLTASNLITNNLSVIGDTSIFNSTIYQTEQFQIVNDTTATAMIVKQLNSNYNISEFYYNNQNIVNISITGTGNSINTPFDNSNYKYAIFNSNGTFVIDNNISCDILIIGGGGGGGGGFGAGGGAGALIYKTNYQLNSGTYTINIGTGGAGGNTTSGAGGVVCGGYNGNDTIITNTIGTTIFNAKGGGGGGAWGSDAGKNGGSGGGCTNNNTAGTAVTTNVPQDADVFGNSGGRETIYTASIISGGGGGGAGAAGGVGSTAGNGNGGNGGIGKIINITGISNYYAGGGGGCLYKTSASGTAGIGGLGGGGNGSFTVNTTGNGINGTANTGGGGGGASGPGGSGGIGGIGGSGVVIIRYLLPNNNLGLVINSNGNVGIGITNPTQKLDVLGTINTNAMNIRGVDITTIITSNDTYTSNLTFLNLSNINYTSSNNLNINKQNNLTNSTILYGIGSNISNLNYNNFFNKPDLSIFTTTSNLTATSNTLFTNLSNIDYISSNSNFNYSSNRIFGIITSNYQWTTTGNNIYLNISGNTGIGSLIPTEKLDINGNTNTNELLIKKLNISNIFVTSNVFDNRSNILYTSLSNQDYITSNNCIQYTNIKTTGLSAGGGGGGDGSGSSYWIQTVNSNIYTTTNVGIGISTPQSKLDIQGDINYSGSLKLNNTIIPFSTIPYTNIIASNAFFSNVNNSYGYYMFLTSGSITFPQATNCDLLLIGAGGNGGLSGGGGGGGSGELIYYPNYPFSVGTSNIQIGYSSFNELNRITKISNSSIDYVIAKGGGDGGYGIIVTLTGTNNVINNATDNSNYKYAYFATSGTFTTNTNLTCDILIIGGGGGGGNGTSGCWEPGGGGAGGVVYMVNKTISAGSYNIIVGNGGSAQTNGVDSSIKIDASNFLIYDGISLIGRGGGAGATNNGTGSNGGSGGGGTHPTTNGGTSTQGNTYWNGSAYIAGGYNGEKPGAGSRGGGGGGSFENGGTDGIGYGGDGLSVSITGTATFYAGGGSAYPNNTTSGNDGGGGYLNLAGTANTGGGGGGGYNAANGVSTGGAGGSGVVIIRYLNTLTTGNINNTIFTYNGSIQTFIVPSGVTSINIYCWGAGGGSGSSYNNQAGGDGGFVKATLSVTPNTSFKIIVGQGGRKGVNGGSSGTAFGGGGTGYGGAPWELGGGGGLSGIFVDNANMTVTNNFINTSATPIIIAGAGGASGGRQDNNAAYPGGNGGSNIGNDSGTGVEGGKGATQSAGGAAGTGGIGNGNQGILLGGGNGNGSYGGGGGGGYYGGGGAGVNGGIVGGGGGGSSFVNTGSYTITNITNLKTATNNSRSPPGTTETVYISGVAVGAATGNNNGGDGLIVIQYATYGSGGGSFLNNSVGVAGTKWNSTYSYLNSGTVGTTTQGGSGGSVLASSGFTESITNNNLLIGTGGTGATISSVPIIKTTYGSGGDGNGGIGTQGLALIKVPLNIQQPTFNGYVYYNNIVNKPTFNDILLSSNLITTNINNQINFPNGNVSWGNEWFLYVGTSPTFANNSLIFNHLTSTINSKWWFNGSTVSTNAEISDERIKKDIQDISNPLDKLMLLKPKEYYLCDDKDYLKKYGIIAQEVNEKEDLNHLVYNDTDYIANIYIYASYEKQGNINKLITNLSIINKIEVEDELKLLLNNTDNIEIIIEDSPYHNRYKKRFVKVKRIIDEYSFEIYDDIELNNNEKNNIFIYGKKVIDFKKLDYSSLYSLNIKATQELYKLIREQETIIETLQTRIIELENKI